ncbi:MAG TPA: hypothetical protein VEV65_02715, partial [Kineosporiaceae bacterium]|nr:hypothetical protein [Kineosporiaceae bacterium]
MGSGVRVPVTPPLAEPRWRLSRDQVLALVTVLVVATGTVLRLRAVLAAPGVLYPDETYQMTEAAHRVVFGYGITPWEFEQGLRSWLGPGLLLPPTALGGVLGLDGLHLTMLVRAWVVLGSAVGAGAAAVAARRLAGPVAGLLAAALVAFSPVLAVYDVHPLADTVAAPLPVLALALLLTRSRREFPASVAAGGLLAASVALRPQAGVLVLGLVAAAVLGRSRPRVLGLLAGLAGGALLTGVLDLLAWGVPFAPEWRSVTFNVVEGGADTWGRQPPTFYADHLAHLLGPLPAAVVVLGLAAALLPFRDPVPAPVPAWPVVLGVLGFVGVLSLIGHKELRFVLPALPIAAALGAAGVVRAVRRPAVTASAAVSVAVAGAVVMPGIRMSDLGYPGDARSAWTIDPATPRLLS